MKNQAAIDRPDGLLLTLSGFMSPARRRQAFILLILMPLAAVAEMASVASVVPLIAALTSNGGANDLPWLAEVPGGGGVTVGAGVGAGGGGGVGAGGAATP